MVISMTVVLLMAAAAIDVGTWYVKHHQAQVAADSAALAAANCMASASEDSTSTTTGGCTGTSTTAEENAAATVATNIAAADGVKLPAGDVSFNGTTVTVAAPKTAAPLFAGVAGIKKNTAISASAAATWTGHDCDDPTTGSCYTFFSADTDCSGGSNGVTVNGSFVDIEGNIHSNANLNLADGFSFFDNFGGTNVYNSASGCEGNIGFFDSGKVTAGPTIPTWPINYANQWPACTVTSYASTLYLSVFPGSSSSYQQLEPNQVYCDYGPESADPNPTNPNTWTGNIVIEAPGAGFSNYGVFNDTYIGETVTSNDFADTFEPYGYDAADPAASKTGLLAYGSGTGTAVNFAGGLALWEGDIFAPNGNVDLEGGLSEANVFVEAQNIDVPYAILWYGEGPKGSGDGASDSLVQ